MFSDVRQSSAPARRVNLLDEYTPPDLDTYVSLRDDYAVSPPMVDKLLALL